MQPEVPQVSTDGLPHTQEALSGGREEGVRWGAGGGAEHSEGGMALGVEGCFSLMTCFNIHDCR